MPNAPPPNHPRIRPWFGAASVLFVLLIGLGYAGLMVWSNYRWNIHQSERLAMRLDAWGIYYIALAAHVLGLTSGLLARIRREPGKLPMAGLVMNAIGVLCVGLSVLERVSPFLHLPK